MDKETQLAELRSEIDGIDAKIVELVDQRADVVRRVGELKGATGTAVFRPERENLILERAASLSRNFDGPAVKAIFREIISSCRALERTTTVAYLGPAGTFSEMAVLRQFGSSVEARPCSTIADVFRMTENSRTDFGVVPVENSTQGTVAVTLDLLLDTSLTIVGEVSIPIIHNLLTRSGDLSKVKTVMAHPQALAQCREWLSTHLPGARQVSCSSNAEGARIASEDDSVGAIASHRAAELYQLGIAGEGIQDWAGNRTRFLVLGHHPTHRSPEPGKDKTTFEFSMVNKAGALFEGLEPLARHGVSMTHLESRPARNGAWEYNFFVDVEGHIEDEAVKKALTEIKAETAVFKFLGSYPKALD